MNKDNSTQQGGNAVSECETADSVKLTETIIDGVLRAIDRFNSPSWLTVAYRMGLVLIIVSAIVVLGWRNIIGENTIGTLMGGVIGYVLAAFKKGIE